MSRIVIPRAQAEFEDRLIYYIVRDDIIDVVRVLGAPQHRDDALFEG